ncbi:MAG: hypothetical protein AAF664_10775 [Planctomycetota bacterium]
MKISGLSNQWKTRDGLFGSFIDGLCDRSDPILHQRCLAIRRLLESLESIDGPDIWVGTSHQLMHFVLRDATHPFDQVSSFVHAHTYDISADPPECGYRIGFSLTGAEWEYTICTDPIDAAKLIERLIRSMSR